MDIAIILIYAVGMLVLGWFGMRRAKSSEDFLVAGRRLGPGMYMGTLSAAALGGASTIGTVRLGYEYGISALWLCTSMGVGIILVNVFLAKHLLKLKIYTVNQALELKYNATVKRVSAGITFCYASMICVVSFVAIGSIAQVVLGLSPISALICGAAIVVVYSTVGGMWSVTLTDMVQFVIKTVGMLLILLPICFYQIGGVSEFTNRLPETSFDLHAIGWDKIVTYFVIYCFGMLIGQDSWQRIFTARSERVAKYAGSAAGLYCLIYGVAGALIGMCAYILLPDIANPQNTFAQIVQSVLPPGIRGLVLAAALSAMMSTASAGLLAASSTFTEDLLVDKKFTSLGWNRLATLMVGLIAMAISIWIDDVLVALTIAYNLLVSGTLIPLLGAIYWKRASTGGAVSSMLGGFFVCIVLMVVKGVDSNAPIYGGLVVSFSCFVLFSLLSKQSLRGAPIKNV